MRVCRDAFWYKDDVKAVFVAAGTPGHVWDRHAGDDVSKAKTARAVLGELVAMGERGNVVQLRLVEELCRMDRPHADAEDPVKGKAALADLRRKAQASAVLVDPDVAATKNRRATAEQKQRAIEQRRQRLAQVKDAFFGLLTLNPTTQAERQKRGYDLERVLVDLFAVHDLAYKPPYRSSHEQVDGSFHFRGFTYLVEAKWQTTQPDFGDMAKFKANVDGKLESTRGMFVSMAGYDDNVLEHFFKVARNSRNNLILFDAADLIAVFEGRVALDDALSEKVDAAEQQGVAWHPLGR